MKLVSTVLSYSLLISNIRTTRDSPTPIVLWHGMCDVSNASRSMGSIISMIKTRIPDIHVHSIEFSKSEMTEKMYTFIGNVNSQVEQVCRDIKSNPKLRNGYHAIGFSQGAQFLRAVAQRCPDPPMKNFISIGGQHQGIFGIPLCLNRNMSHYCYVVNWLFNSGAYSWFSQNYIIQAQFWHDPLDEARYRKYSIFLADINNENVINEDYRTNLKKLENFVMVKFEKDTVVVPRESQWFGFFQEGDDTKVLPLKKTRLYSQDFLGLKAMEKAGKLHFLSVNSDHLRFNEPWFVDNIINKFIM